MKKFRAMAMSMAKVCVLAALGVSATNTLEEALANVSSQVTGKFGKSFTLKLEKSDEDFFGNGLNG